MKQGEGLRQMSNLDEVSWDQMERKRSGQV